MSARYDCDGGGDGDDDGGGGDGGATIPKDCPTECAQACRTFTHDVARTAGFHHAARTAVPASDGVFHFLAVFLSVLFLCCKFT